LPKNRYNAGFQKQDETDMVEGIIDIPLPGNVANPGGSELTALGQRHFLAGPENRLVDVAVRSVLEEPETGYNPLVLYGPSGTGKSHIARGLAAVWKARHHRDRVVCVTAVEFAQELAEAIESQAVEEFRTTYRTADLLVMEDLGQLAARKSEKLSAQEEFVHTLDALLTEGRWVVVTASAAPAELPGLLPALQSRLAAGLSIPLAPPGSKARRALLRQFAASKEIELPEPVVKVLAEGLGGTAPELAGALMQLASPDCFGDDPIDMESAREFLSQRNGKQHQPTMHKIALATARHFSLRLTDLRSSTRRRSLVSARGVAVYLARHFAGMSFQEIGCYFGGRDHSTVMHSCHKTEELSESDPTIHKAIKRLHKELWKT
jgi:chromosomal replication initiator protein